MERGLCIYFLKVKDEISEEEVFSHVSHQDPFYRQGKEFIHQEGDAFPLKTRV